MQNRITQPVSCITTKDLLMLGVPIFSFNIPSLFNPNFNNCNTLLVNKANLVHNFFSMFISFLYMFWMTVPIIRRNNCICATPGICRCMWMTVWHAGWNEFSFHSAYQTVIHIQRQISSVA